MKKITKQKWVNALRSGKFEQGSGRLCEGDKYCCLGVLAKITGNLVNGIFKGIGGSHFHLGKNVDTELEKQKPSYSLLPMSDQEELMLFNDAYGKSFSEIADWIEENVETED